MHHYLITNPFHMDSWPAKPILRILVDIREMMVPELLHHNMHDALPWFLNCIIAKIVPQQHHHHVYQLCSTPRQHVQTDGCNGETPADDD